jgi:hypothetical protein
LDTGKRGFPKSCLIHDSFNRHKLAAMWSEAWWNNVVWGEGRTFMPACGSRNSLSPTSWKVFIISVAAATSSGPLSATDSLTRTKSESHHSRSLNKPPACRKGEGGSGDGAREGMEKQHGRHGHIRFLSALPVAV